MNKFIEEQLKKVEIADLSNFDKETNTFHIKRIVDNTIIPEVNKCYIIQLDKSLLDKNNFLDLINNWNRGTVPPGEYLRIYVLANLKNMFKVDAILYDFERKEIITRVWNGWLPIQQFKVIECL